MGYATSALWAKLSHMNWIAWAAGLFEGEGCFFINTVRKEGKSYRYPCATLKMTDEDVVRKFHEIVGVGKVWRKPAARLGWKPQWDWRCHGSEETEKVFELLSPYLFSRRMLLATNVLTVKAKEKHKALTGHGTRKSYREGCRCKECKAYNAERARNYRAKTHGPRFS